MADASWVEAETDADAVGFYEEVGFTVTGLGESYPGSSAFGAFERSSDLVRERSRVTATPRAGIEPPTAVIET
ncbi:MAG TPA: hypothetical protein VGU02_06345 [Gaiellaceae bacterium]|nr:hypothetical protein [Gaiellaceae bacterium]